MKKSLLVLALAALSTSAFADLAQQTIRRGADVVVMAGLNSHTCKTQDVRVVFEGIDANKLSQDKATAEKPFKIVLTECPDSFWQEGSEGLVGGDVGKRVSRVSVTFDGVGKQQVNSNNGVLENMITGSAASKGVQAQILENGTVLDLRNPNVTQLKKLSKDVSTHEFEFGAKLISDGNVVPGVFGTAIPFNIVYK